MLHHLEDDLLASVTDLPQTHAQIEGSEHLFLLVHAGDGHEVVQQGAVSGLDGDVLDVEDDLAQLDAVLVAGDVYLLHYCIDDGIEDGLVVFVKGMLLAIELVEDDLQICP